MEKMVALLRDKGYKITPQRRAVLAALLACGKFCTAQQILEFVRRSSPDISLDTVYRNLALLMELGVVHEVHTKSRDGNAFEIVLSGHHHHLICTQCGCAECLEICPIDPGIEQAAAAHGFSITGHLFEVYGKCRLCRAKEEGTV